MASHTELRVGDSDWVIRDGGVDVQVKILEKTKKASGRGWEFRVKRVGSDGRVTGRNLVRGSGSLRRPGVPPKTTGFAKGKGTKKVMAARKNTPKPTKPRAAPRVRRNPPASAFFSEVQEPGTSRSSSVTPNGSASGLGSLRGRGRSRRSSAAAPARPGRAGTTPSQARREIEKQLKYADLPPLVNGLMKALFKSDGTTTSVSRIYGEVVHSYNMSLHGGAFRTFQ